MISLSPNAEWFSRYTGSNDSTGENQQIFFAVYLQGNDPLPVNSMLPLQLTATPEEYAEIQQELHPSSSPPTTASSSAAASASMASDSASDSLASDSASSLFKATETLTETASTELSIVSQSDEPLAPNDRSGLSGGAIAGIVVGSFLGLLLLLLLVLVPLYRRRQRQRRMLEKSAAMAEANTSSSLDAGHPGGGSDAAVAAVVAGAAVAAEKPRPDSTSPSDTPLLLGGRPNNSFNSREGSMVDSQLSPRTVVYQPLNLESPRVMMNMPASTRAASTTVKSPDPILSTDDARQIGDIFRDALRKPPPVSEDGTSESPGKRDSMLMHMDDELEEDEDPGWRERVASERMQRELQQEASVIRSVALRAHGSDYSSSRPGTSQSNSSLRDI
ncbi:hypothetical protein H4R24_004971 [Coemansia sp. RSA 988]|nr:hypothetical protein H4R24_004971 [Coemansia sp. RSA 988]